MPLPLIYIHGAFSSRLSFARIIEKLPPHEHHLVEYQADEQLVNVATRVSQLVDQIGDCHIVAHSLGGLVAHLVAQTTNQVQSVLTISSPFGGNSSANTLRWFSSHQLYQSLNPHGSVLRSVHSSCVPCQFRSIVTTTGNNPMIYGENDGVVSVVSQEALKGVEQVRLPFNHFEVLLSDTIVEQIKDFIAFDPPAV